MSGEHESKDAVDFFFQDWLPEDSSRLLVILGPAGYGKTMLSFEVARRLAEAHLASQLPDKRPLPFLVPFGEFRRVAEFEGMILSSLHRRGVTDFTAGAFAHLVGQKRVVLFLDGFDELLEERPNEAQKNLRELIETLKGEGQVVLTARSTFFRTSVDVSDFLEHYLEPSDVSVVELLPFDRSQRRSLVVRLSGTPDAERRILRVVEADSIREAMGSPLLLRQTIEALQSGTATLGSTPTRLELFSVLEESVYERERARHAHRVPDRTQRSMLTTLAGDMLRSNVRGHDITEVQVAAAEAMGDALSGTGELEKFADHHFLTVDEHSQEVRFNHQVFREYFQAIWLLNEINSQDAASYTDVLSRRPVPEAVTGFLADIGGVGLAMRVIATSSDGGWSSERLVSNIGQLCASLRDEEVLVKFLNAVTDGKPISIRLDGFRLTGADLSDHLFSRLELVNCDLAGAVFKNCTVTELVTCDTNWRDVELDGTEVVAALFDYETWEYGTTSVMERLGSLGAAVGTTIDRTSIQNASRAIATDAIAGRLRRFYVAGIEGTGGSRWDQHIKEQNLLGGLDHVQRRYAATKVLPALRSEGIISRWKEHGDFVYRLEDDAKDDARALLEEDVIRGTIAHAIARLS